MSRIIFSEEELIAEFGSAFLCHEAGIENNIAISASYIDGWKSFLTNNPKVLVTCASKAQKSTDYILGRKEPVTETE